MANKMLIDATHPEETRVVVLRGQRIEEFDFESADRKPLRGNIYLAKVTRVEPSLQAAFVEYGGNRHGFLAFSEIHPDYYQIPVADREALLAEDRRADEDEDARSERSEKRGRRPRRGSRAAKAANGESVSAEAAPAEEAEAAQAETAGEEIEAHEADADEANGEEKEIVEQIGGGDILEDVPERPRVARRNYKIQEVIKRRQILLVQVVKEERGSKGAALTTYLSLAGRYSVLMPNTGRGGGISRKITSAEDRKRLKEIVQELDVPDGMGIILRTAGAARTKPEIKRDYEYLMRMWEKVRELTLESSAPALVYEEGSLVRRAIRDLFNKDIDEVQVAGEEAYREAKDFMKLMMPSQAKSVKAYRDAQPLFAKFGIETQLDALFTSTVTLKSGGYLVINQAEALVAIDINSGRSTREHNIEDTALKTNLEAAEEIARQLRLRDLAGLVVIDFIDMEERRNNRAVEKRLADCLKNDRARIQLGRISSFGLLEMSRQRIRTGVLESSSLPCPHCGGSGLMRANSSVALQILRALEETLIRNANHHLTVKTRPAVALYVLNHKRGHLRELELRFGVTITIVVDDHLTGVTYYAVEKGELVSPEARALLTAARATQSTRAVLASEEIESDSARDEAESQEEIDGDEEMETEAAEGSEAGADGEGGERDGARRRRRRRRRRGRGGERSLEGNGEAAEATAEGEDDEEQTGEETSEAEGGEDAPARDGERGGRRRRGRRGGRRNRGPREDGAIEEPAAGVAPGEEPVAESAVVEAAAEPVTEEVASEAEPKAKPRRSRKAKAAEEPAEAVAAPAEEAPAAKPKGRARKAKAKEAEPEVVAAPAPEAAAEAETAPEAPVEAAPPAEPVHVVLTPPDPDRPKRFGWWRRG